jgi:folate-dependent phosphoribosylglycinamide formyltransferase PurN
MAPSLPSPRLLLIGSDNPTTWIVYNRLVREFGLFDALIENTVEKRVLIRNRVRKLGWPAVLSQIAFVALIRPVLRYQSGGRVREICRAHDLEIHEPFSPAVRRVENINGPDAVAFISASKPDVVIVNGTRILKPHVLGCTAATFINTHQGITPKYRGAHGGYWALHENDPERCGVTLHLVDQGIDTGNIIAQALITPGLSDCYISYPYLQIAAALPFLIRAVRDCVAGRLQTSKAGGESAVWYHPGFFQYIRARLRGVR